MKMSATINVSQSIYGDTYYDRHQYGKRPPGGYIMTISHKIYAFHKKKSRGIPILHYRKYILFISCLKRSDVFLVKS